MSPTVSDVLRRGAEVLTLAGIDGGGRDARILLAHILNQEPGRLLLNHDQIVPKSVVGAYEAMIAERVTYRPVSQIIGHREFWGRRFVIDGDVLDPRPETETIIAVVSTLNPPSRVLDLGTGSGILALTLLCEYPDATAIAVDVSDAALAVAKRNASGLGVVDRVEFRKSDWFSDVEGQFDLIVGNPPYITAGEMAGLAPDVANWEPHLALAGGPDGLAPYRTIAGGLDRHLAPQGVAILEHGSQQAAAVAEIFSAWECHTECDLNGHERLVVIKK